MLQELRVQLARKETLVLRVEWAQLVPQEDQGLMAWPEN